jgi:pyruvate-formate lyase-activating enzyme
MATLVPPTARATLTLGELASVQATARSHLTFSLTLACPLKCAHCIVEAGPDKRATTMPLEIARKYAVQMPALYERGITMVSFTGGEPLLARPQLRVLSDAAAEAGMVCGVVTAAHWAVKQTEATRVIERFPGINTWDLSLDAYHEDYLSPDRVRLAYLAAKGLGRRVVLRFAYHEPLTEADRRLLEFMAGFADEHDICSQRVRSVGRAAGRPFPDGDLQDLLAKPCMTKGLVIRYDGTMAPCCINLVEERQHPFQFGDARTRPLIDVHAEYARHPLLQMIRAVGFGEVLRWLEEEGAQVPSPLPEDVCDLCPRVMTNRRWAEALAVRAAKPANQLRIAILVSKILGEHDMLQQTVHDLRSQANGIEGFDAAARLVDELISDHKSATRGDPS